MGTHSLNKLNAKTVKHAKAGKYEDGGGLRLVVSDGLSRRWVLRYTIHGKRREMGLGNVDSVSLSDARDSAKKYRNLAKSGKEPIHERDKQNLIIPTFTQCSARLIRAKRGEWKNRKHGRQWVSTLKYYARPTIGNKPVNAITTDDVLDCLKPIWNSKTETANRVRSRIENVLDYGIAHDYREGPNPARWRGHLDKILPSPKKISKPVHHPAMPINKAPGFYGQLIEREAISALALRFLMLTATRTSETLEAEWTEFDGDTWTIPAKRMKAGTHHRVPLTPEAIQILEIVSPFSNQFVFVGDTCKPLSNMAMLMLMKRMNWGKDAKHGDAVPHGFRSTFRDWCSEHTSYSRDASEMALAHTIKDDSEAAYRRGDLLDTRRQMMNDWAKFLTGAKPNE